MRETTADGLHPANIVGVRAPAPYGQLSDAPSMTAQERAAYDEFKAASLDLKAKKAAYDEAAVRVRDAINEMANAAAGSK